MPIDTDRTIDRSETDRDGSAGPRATGPEREPHPATELVSSVIEYETRPDRLTIYPRDGPSDRKITTWLTANRSAFVDLEAHR